MTAERDGKRAELETLSLRRPQDIWITDLDALETALDVFEEAIEEDKRQEQAAQRKAGKAGTAKRAGGKKAPASKKVLKKKPVNSDNEDESDVSAEEEDDFDEAGSDSDFEESKKKKAPIKSKNNSKSVASAVSVAKAPLGVNKSSANANEATASVKKPILSAAVKGTAQSDVRSYLKPEPVKPQPAAVPQKELTFAERILAKLNKQELVNLPVINDEIEVVWTGASNASVFNDLSTSIANKAAPATACISLKSAAPRASAPKTKKTVVSDDDKTMDANDGSDSDFENDKKVKQSRKRPVKKDADSTKVPLKAAVVSKQPIQLSDQFSPGLVSSPRDAKKARQVVDITAVVTNLVSDCPSPLAKPAAEKKSAKPKAAASKSKVAAAEKKPKAEKAMTKATKKVKVIDSGDESDAFSFRGSDDDNDDVVHKRPSPKPARARKTINYAQFDDDEEEEF